jgi:hypothetical protein
MKTLRDCDYKVYFGVTREEFEFILRSLQPLGDPESSSESLAMLLMYLTLDNSQTVIASHFKKNQSTVSRNIAAARAAMEQLFVPKYLGYSHISRERYYY